MTTIRQFLTIALAMHFNGRIATDVDVAELAVMNQQLIRDEKHRNAMSTAELEERMRKWIGGSYEAVLFAVKCSTVGYALYRHERDWTYLRHFYIWPEHRRKGIGRRAMQWLFQNSWRDSRRIRLDVLVGNTDGIAFWRSIGFQDYCTTMEMDARTLEPGDS